jgi:hypothetical protein
MAWDDMEDMMDGLGRSGRLPSREDHKGGHKTEVEEGVEADRDVGPMRCRSFVSEDSDPDQNASPKEEVYIACLVRRNSVRLPRVVATVPDLASPSSSRLSTAAYL